MTSLLGLLCLVALALASTCLASIEAAFYRLKRRRLGHVAFPNPRAETTNGYLEDPPRLLMPIHVGTYVAHVAMTGILVLLTIGRLGRWAVGLALILMLVYLVVFRLATPHAIARRNPERVLLFLVPLLDRYFRALMPLVALLRRSIALDEAPTSKTTETTDNPVLASSAPAASPESEERQLLNAVERFTTLLVRNVMTPRPDIVAVPETTTIDETRKVVAATKHSRLPVYRDNLDDVLGIVSVRDLIEYANEGEAPVASLVRPIHVVPESKPVIDLLRELQSLHATIALVVDEYGGVAGIASMEDIIEELVGDIEDEYDFEGESIVAEPDGSYLMSGRAELSRVEQTLETSLGEAGDVDTAGGLVAKVFGRIPHTGESIEYRNFTIEVIDAAPRRVNRIRFRRHAQGDEA